MEPPLVSAGVNTQVTGSQTGIGFAEQDFEFSTDGPMVVDTMRVASAYFGIDVGVHTQTCEVEVVDAAVEVSHTAAEEEIKHGLRYTYAQVDLLVQAKCEEAVVLDTETHVEQTERHVAIDEREFAELAQQFLTVASLGVEGRNGLTVVGIDEVAHCQRVVAYPEACYSRAG